MFALPETFTEGHRRAAFRPHRAKGLQPAPDQASTRVRSLLFLRAGSLFIHLGKLGVAGFEGVFVGLFLTRAAAGEEQGYHGEAK